MKQLYYTLRYLLRARGGNTIKIVSLTLGFGVGLLLFARVAFELSFDSFFGNVENLYVVNTHYAIQGEDYGTSTSVYAPLAPAMLDEFPDLSAATTCRKAYGEFSLFHENHKFTPEVVLADSLFFKTMQIDILRGDDRRLGMPDQIFLSESFARRIFGSDDPVGQQLYYAKNYPYTVAGIFRDIPENTHLRFEAVVSFINQKIQFGNYCGWGQDDSYNAYVRLKPGADIRALEAKIPALVSRHVDVEYERENGLVEDYMLTPVAEIYTHDPEVRRMVIIMSLLGFALMFVAAMNYVLMSVSSLPLRARAVGVHKCSGATGSTIFGQFMVETMALFGAALFCLGLLLLAFRQQVAEMTAVRSLGSLLNAQTLGLPALVLLVIFLVAGVLPARLFARIPVTQIFRVSNTGKRGWKRCLLFVQFAGIAFVISLLVVVLLQYHYLMDRDMGYRSENVVYAGLKGIRDKASLDMLKAEFRKLPYVEGVAVSGNNLISGYGGMLINDEAGNILFTTRQNTFDPAVLPLMDIRLAEGRNIQREGELLVNETFVEKRGWKDGAIGQEIRQDNETVGRVVGVMKDFHIYSFYIPQQPVLVKGREALPDGVFTLRLTELTAERLAELNELIDRLYPDQDMGFTVMKHQLESQYEGARHFRDAVVLATLAILMITLMGLLGYISDEIHRRSKEIAMRKVNGATVGNILRLLSKDVLLTAMPALILAVILSRYVSEIWLQQFAEKIPLHVFIFIGSCGLVLVLIWGCVVARSWKVASDNPVESIKNE